MLTEVQAGAEITEGTVGGRRDRFAALSGRKSRGLRFLLSTMDRSTTVATQLWKSDKEIHGSLGWNYTVLLGCFLYLWFYGLQDSFP